MPATVFIHKNAVYYSSPSVSYLIIFIVNVLIIPFAVGWVCYISSITFLFMLELNKIGADYWTVNWKSSDDRTEWYFELHKSFLNELELLSKLGVLTKEIW